MELEGGGGGRETMIVVEGSGAELSIILDSETE